MKALIQLNNNYFLVEMQDFASLSCPDYKFDYVIMPIFVSRTCSNNENKIDACLRRNDDHTCHSHEGGNLGFVFLPKLQLLEMPVMPNDIVQDH